MSHLPFPEEELAPRLMCADPQALAYAWIRAYLENLNSRIQTEDEVMHEGTDDEYTSEADGDLIDLDELIETAMSHVDTDSRYGGDYITRGGAFEGVGTDDMFWEKLAILKGIEIPEEKRGNFFSCSC
jgi:hypothetical protein